MSYDTLSDFLEPVNKHVISEDMGYKERQTRVYRAILDAAL